MEQRSLGTSGLVVSAQGLGCMGMSSTYGEADDDTSIATIHHALDRGVTFLDTANVYGKGHNEQLVGRAIAGRRDEVVLATKFSFTGDTERPINGDPDYVRACCDASLARLGVDHVDLYYQHRVDPTVPIEDTVGAMAGLVDSGKVRFLGLSEASSNTLERAVAVHPIAALQSEWSLWTRDLEHDVVAACRRLGVGIVPFSPLGRGFLTGAVTSTEFDSGDVRAAMPRFQAENMARNLELVAAVRELAAAKGVTAGQVALAWVQAQGDDVVPIPGTKRQTYLDENVGALDVDLTADDLAALDAMAPAGVAVGDRYAFAHQYGDSPAR